MDGVTLALAIVGVVLSIASLAWQAVTFTLSGYRVKVTLLYGGLNPVQGTLMWNISTRSKDTGLGDNFVAIVVVQATNTGRGDIDIMEWGLRLNDEGSLSNPSDLNVAVPLRLRHGSQQNWFIGDDGVQAAVDALVRPGPVKVEGFVRLGNGKTKRSKPYIMERSHDA